MKRKRKRKSKRKRKGKGIVIIRIRMLRVIMIMIFIIIIIIYIYWSKPGSINTPQKQDENRGFGPGQAGGRTPGKLGGNVPVKLAKMRGKKEQQTSRNVASKGTTWHHHKLFIIICFQVGMCPALLQDTRCIPGFHYRS